MPLPIHLPKFDPSHEQSLIVNWLVAPGSTVREGDPLCEVETDKVNMEVEAPGDGTLAGLRYNAGETAAVTEILAYLLLDGESEADLPEAPAVTRPAAPTAQESIPAASATPVARKVAANHGVAVASVQGSGPRGRVTRRDVEAHVAAQQMPIGATPTAPGKVRATPAARRLAREHDLPLSTINGSGPRGRVQAADVTTAAATGPTKRDGDIRARYPLGRMRKAIAAKMQQSVSDAPHIYVEMPVVMDAVIAMRARFKAEGDTLSLTAVLVKACALALQRHPRVNATFDGETVTEWRAANIGVAVALDDGLQVPVVHDAAARGLGDIQTQSSDLVARARAGTLSGADVSGGTFTISNMGMFGVKRFTAIINPPQVAILAVGGIERVFVPDADDTPVAQSRMMLVLSVDHRVLDGADAARFLADVRATLENPLRLAW